MHAQSDFKHNDARLLLLSFLLCTFCIWALPFVFLAIFALLYSILFFYNSNKKQRDIAFFKALCVFCIAWTLCIFLAYCIDIEDFKISFNTEYASLFVFLSMALHFTLRLFLVALLGLNLFIIASPKDYALALTYFFSFISKKNAWKVGLMTLLILKYFYELHALCLDLGKSVQYRLKTKVGARKKMYYFVQNLLKILAERNYALSIALFARGFNKPCAFEKEWNFLFSKENISIHAFILIFNSMPCLVYILTRL